MSDEKYDVVVIGGGAAGLSAALTLSRARRSVLVVDAGKPRNAPAGGVHNYLGREGVSPHELVATGRAEVTSYGGQVRDGLVTALSGAAGDFRVELDGGAVVRAARVVLASGLGDRLPDVAGLAERWGRDVVHCPYCHGWEIRDQHIGVLASAVMLPTHQAQLFRQWSDRVTLFVHGAEIGADDRRALVARGITVVEDTVAALVVDDDRLTGVRLGDGSVVALDALAVPAPVRAHSALAEQLGAEVTTLPFGTQLVVDDLGATTVPGLFAAGNVSNQTAVVIGAAAEGVRVGAMVNLDLVTEEIATAVAASG